MILGSFSWFQKQVGHNSPEEQEYIRAAKAQFYTASNVPLPCNWKGVVFQPNFNFPKEKDEKEWTNPETHPWLKYNFKTEPEKYLQAVLDYCFDGNIVNDVEKCFDVSRNQNNKKWWHAAWQHSGPSGRCSIHGGTLELPSQPGQISDNQKRVCQSYAIGFYNSPGAYIFNEIWKDPAHPNVDGNFGKGILFPEGTVSFKLLFTQATEAEAPFLVGAPTWKAMVQEYPGTQRADPSPKRILGDVRLTQIDVAVKDSRFDSPTNWIFGSFIYDSSVQHANPWRRLIDIGLQWGSDSKRTLADKDLPLQEGWLNPVAKNRIITKTRPMVGFANRLAGPVDAYQSACLNCHAVASFPSVKDMVPKVVDANRDLGNREQDYFFRNLMCGEIFDDNLSYYEPMPAQQVHSLDYSMQLQQGLNNFYVWRKAAFPNIADSHVESFHVPGKRMDPQLAAKAKVMSGDINHNHSQSS